MNWAKKKIAAPRQMTNETDPSALDEMLIVVSSTLQQEAKLAKENPVEEKNDQEQKPKVGESSSSTAAAAPSNPLANIDMTAGKEDKK